MPRNSSPAVHCEGWWEQPSYGRQPMEHLRFSFQDGCIQGSGTDIIGPFVFTGTIADHGGVAMRKQYIGQHSVEYLGTYDGEGLMSGEWRIDVFHGPWLIKIRRVGAEATPKIKDVVPAREA